MQTRSGSHKALLTTLVVAHLGVSLVHGAAHAAAPVPLSAPASLFVLLVIVIGPVAGLVLHFRAQPLGAWVIAVSMAGSLFFGLVNHFWIEGTDHIGHVTGPWQGIFAITAVLLAATEAAGSAAAVWCIASTRRSS